MLRDPKLDKLEKIAIDNVAYNNEIRRLLAADNEFCLMETSIDMITYDTTWVGFRNALEGRVLGYRRINNFQQLIELGYNLFVIDAYTMAAWLINLGKAIVHRKVIEIVFPDLLKPRLIRWSFTKGMVGKDHIGYWKRKPNKKERKKIIEKYNSKCVICSSTENLTIHHIIPYKKGGTTEINNSILLCRTCHDKIDEEGPFKVLPQEILKEILKLPFGLHIYESITDFPAHLNFGLFDARE